MKGPLCPTCSLSAVVSLLKRQLFLRRSVCVCVCALVCMSVSQCQGACGGWGEGWLCVALTAPLHIKRLVPSGDLLVHNTAACAYVASFLFIAL